MQDLPLEGEEDPLIEPSQVEPDFSLDERTERMIRIRKEALENIAKAQARQKKYYDAKHCKDKAQDKVGSLVLLLNSKKYYDAKHCKDKAQYKEGSLVLNSKNTMM